MMVTHPVALREPMFPNAKPFGIKFLGSESLVHFMIENVCIQSKETGVERITFGDIEKLIIIRGHQRIELYRWAVGASGSVNYQRFSWYW